MADDYRHLIALTLECRSAVATGDAEQLLLLLDQRQIVIDRIAQLNREGQQLGPSDQAILTALAEADQILQAEAASYKEQCREDLKTTRDFQSIRAYGQNPATTSRILDVTE